MVQIIKLLNVPINTRVILADEKEQELEHFRVGAETSTFVVSVPIQKISFMANHGDYFKARIDGEIKKQPISVSSPQFMGHFSREFLVLAGACLMPDVGGEYYSGIFGCNTNDALLVIERTTWLGDAPITSVKAVTTPSYRLVTGS